MPPADLPKLHESLALDIDLMIFEYLLHNATLTILNLTRLTMHSPEAKRLRAEATCSEISDHMSMVEGFQKRFKFKHTQHKIEPALQFRLDLLMFVALNSARNEYKLQAIPRYSLEALREQNRARAQDWRSDPKNNAYSSELHEKVMRVGFHRIHGRGSSLARDLDARPTLLDLLPRFIKLTALRSQLSDTRKDIYTCSEPTAKERKGSIGLNSIEDRDLHLDSQSSWGISDFWLCLAADMMFHAALEQLVVHGVDDSMPVLEAFAWGTGSRRSRTSQKDHELHGLFDHGEDIQSSNGRSETSHSESLSSFAVLKQERVRKLTGPTNFRDLWSEHFNEDLELRMLEYVEALFIDLTPPILVQLERGHDIKIDGRVLRPEEARHLRDIAGYISSGE